MALSEGVQASLRFKVYSATALSSTSELSPASDPGASDGQLLRRVSHSLNLRKNTFQSQEIRDDRQVGDFRHGTRRVEGSITGELSPGTYFDLIEAVLRATKTATITRSNTVFTSVAADNGTSTFTFAASDPVSEGFAVGDLVRFNSLSESGNNRNFVITGFSGTSNRVMAVTPAPTTMTADSAFSITRPGSRARIPASSHASRLFAFEDYDGATDISRLFTECRMTGLRLSMPAEGMDTIELMAMGRGMTVYTGGSAPFFASPTAITSTGITAGANGKVLVNGTAVGVITGFEVALSMNADAPSVRGQAFPPEILLGTANVTGTVTALFEDSTMIGNFTAEDEISLLVWSDAGSSTTADAIVVYLPRIKFGAADVQRSGEGAQSITLPFQALRYLGSGIGIQQTTIQIHDTADS